MWLERTRQSTRSGTKWPVSPFSIQSTPVLALRSPFLEDAISPPIPLRDDLKIGTRAQHDRIDAMIGIGDHLDTKSYQHLLLMHAAVLPSLERELEHAAVDALLPDWRERARRTALLADLRDFGLVPPPVIAPALTFSRDDPAAVIGAAYVLEGSRLGGYRLRTLLGERPGTPTAFLDHGRGDASLWRRFLAILNELRPSPAERRRAVDAAGAVFEAYECALSSASRLPVAA